MTEKKKKFRKDYKFKFTKAELKQEVYDALLWACDGLEVRVGDDEPTPYIMGDPENLAIIISVALTEGLPEENSSTSAASSS